jgi:hypothetical protein
VACRGLDREHVERAVAESPDRHSPPAPDDAVSLCEEDGKHLRWTLLKVLQGGETFRYQGQIFHTRSAGGGKVDILEPERPSRVVTGTFTRTAQVVVDLTFRDQKGVESTITGTPEHPFWVPARGRFVRMGELTPGTVLEASDAGTIATVVSTVVRRCEVPVHNVEIEGTHTYFVAAKEGGPAVWVHNACTGDAGVIAEKLAAAQGGDAATAAELRVAKFLDAEGSNVHLLRDTGVGLTPDMAAAGRATEVKYATGLGKNLAYDLAHGVQQAGANGQVVLVRASSAPQSLAQFQDFASNFKPKLPGVTIRVVDEAALPPMLPFPP